MVEIGIRILFFQIKSNHKSIVCSSEHRKRNINFIVFKFTIRIDIFIWYWCFWFHENQFYWIFYITLFTIKSRRLVYKIKINQTPSENMPEKWTAWYFAKVQLVYLLVEVVLNNPWFLNTSSTISLISHLKQYNDNL